MLVNLVGMGRGEGDRERGTELPLVQNSGVELDPLLQYMRSLAFRYLPHISIRFFSKATLKVFS
jgi:hypothetical protein